MIKNVDAITFLPIRRYAKWSKVHLTEDGKITYCGLNLVNRLIAWYEDKSSCTCKTCTRIADLKFEESQK